LLSVFVERGVDMLRTSGFLGAITSRNCFFIGTFKDWREQVVLKRTNTIAFLDLGVGVMDDALVEAAAYAIESVK